MPAIVANTNKFLLNSDYPVDKIILSKSGSFSRTDSTYITPELIPHGLDFIPTYIMQWSTSSNFIPCYSEQLFGDGFSPLLEAQTSSTNLILYSYVPSGTVTFYYRVLFFMPPGITSSVSSSAASFNDFIIDTDSNYPKIFKEDKITSTTEITHGLGFYPLVEFWLHRTSDDIIRHFPVSETDTGNEAGAIVTTTTAKFYLPSGYDYMYYKIYGDEN
jgi:hypothetical protein